MASGDPRHAVVHVDKVLAVFVVLPLGVGNVILEKSVDQEVPLPRGQAVEERVLPERPSVIDSSDMRQGAAASKTLVDTVLDTPSTCSRAAEPTSCLESLHCRQPS